MKKAPDTSGVSHRDLLKTMADSVGHDVKGFSRAKAVLTVLASAGAAYVLGGVVLALRLSQADMPVQDALDVIPFSVLLVTGIRELVISALVAVILLGAMLVLAAPKRIPDFVGLALVPLALLLVVPLDGGGLAWPVGLTVVGLVFLRIKRKRAVDPQWTPQVLPVVSLLVATVLAVTLARYTAPPYKLPRGTVLLRTSDLLREKTLEMRGAFLAETSDFVYLGGAHDEEGDPYVVGYARDRVLSLELLPPPKPPEPSHSLLERVGGPQFAVTPLLDRWEHGHYHGPRVFQ